MPVLAVAQDAWQNRDDPVDHPAQVDPHHPVPVGESGDLGRSDDGDPGVVDQQVELAELAFGGVGGGGIGCAVCNVEPERKHRVATRQFGARRVEMILAHVGDDGIHPLTEQRLGDPSERGPRC